MPRGPVHRERLDRALNDLARNRLEQLGFLKAVEIAAAMECLGHQLNVCALSPPSEDSSHVARG